jgi:hypothetical protein
MIQGRLSTMEMAVYYLWTVQFSLLHVVQTGSGAHPTSYLVGTGDSFPGSKAAEA